MSTATATNPFVKKTSSNEGGDFELPPGASYPAVLVGLIDLGTHAKTFGGKTKDLPILYFVWELTAEHDSHGDTFKVGKEFTASLNAKSKLRPFIEGWLGKKFADDEEFNFASLMLNECIINVTEGTSGAGKKFIDVASATKPMKGLAVPPRTVEPICWTFDGWDIDKPLPIPDWVPRSYGETIPDKIRASKEWLALREAKANAVPY